MSGCGPHSEPGRGGIAAPTHVRDLDIRPESLPPAEDVKKVERRLTSDEKKALKNPDTLEGA